MKGLWWGATGWGYCWLCIAAFSPPCRCSEQLPSPPAQPFLLSLFQPLSQITVRFGFPGEREPEPRRRPPPQEGAELAPAVEEEESEEEEAAAREQEEGEAVHWKGHALIAPLADLYLSGGLSGAWICVGVHWLPACALLGLVL